MNSGCCPVCKQAKTVSRLVFHFWRNSLDQSFRKHYAGTDKGVWYCQCCGFVWVIKGNALFNATFLSSNVKEDIENADTKEKAKEIFLAHNVGQLRSFVLITDQYAHI